LINEVCHDDFVTDFHYSDLKEKIVTSDQAGLVSYWYTSWSDDGGSVFIKFLKDIEHDDRVRSLRLLPEQEKVAAAVEGLGIVVSSIRVPEEEGYWYGVYSSSSKIKLTHDDSNLIIFDTDEWASEAAFAIDLTTGAARKMFGGAPVRWVTSGVLGSTVYGLSEEGRILSEGSDVVEVAGWRMESLRRIEYLPQSDSILAYREGSGLSRLDPKTGTEIASYETQRELRDIVLTQDGNLVLTIWETSLEKLFDDTLLVQRSSDFEVLASAQLSGANRIRISPSNIYALISSGREVWWVDVSTGNTIAEFSEGVSPINDIAISSDESLIAVAYGPLKNQAIVWSLEDNQIIGKYSHNDSVESISFSNDGTRLATASTDNSVAIWDIESGIKVYEFEDGNFYFVDFLPNGDLLFGVNATLFRVATPPVADGILIQPFDALPIDRTCLTPHERERFSLPLLSEEQWSERRCARFAAAN
jgi:WD40 repeat protein